MSVAGNPHPHLGERRDVRYQVQDRLAGIFECWAEGSSGEWIRPLAAGGCDCLLQRLCCTNPYSA